MPQPWQLKKVNPVVSKKPAAFAIVNIHIDKNTKQTLDYYWFDLIGYTTAAARLNKTGDFVLRLKIENQVKEAVIDWGDNDIKLDLIAKDTIKLSWEANNFDRTLVIKATKPERTTELYKANEHYHNIKKDDVMLRSAPLNNLTYKALYTKINALYNKAIKSLLHGGVTPGVKKTAVDLYFNYVNLLSGYGLLPKHDLHLINPTNESRSVPILNTPWAYKTEQTGYYKISRSYRDFIFNYVRLNTLTFNLWKTRRLKSADYEKSFAWKECYAGLDAFNVTEMRDWYVTRCIIGEAFQFRTFEDANTVYREFAPQVKTARYSDTLKKFYAAIKRLKPGGPAPIFTLKDENGKQVSLADFKGRVVYIDFWGVYCGPCIGAIKESVPALHQKYKGKQVVFINICIDTDEKTGRLTLKN
ncbi:TlpA family protein disulfide reductase [Mucilaginibacter antarcticus]|uniref:TlpA family protein disulfide reductase n=1 Tax=Mucilaginibacter antarcticus TaxID=1855725 RepID=UPI003627AEEA